MAKKKMIYVVWHFIGTRGEVLKIFSHNKKAEQYIEELKEENPGFWDREVLTISETELC